MHFWKHLKTVTHHRRLVRQGCFRVGLYRQGLLHDLSKFSPVEFLNGAKYYQGDRSPNSAERKDKGISEAWIHHKGRNPHHYEYWTDLDVNDRFHYVSVPIPRNYLVEMIMDRRAASMTYKKEKYTDASPMEYHEQSYEQYLMHPETRRQLEFLLAMLRDEGEKATFHYLKHSVLAGKPFPWEENPENMEKNA